MYINKLAQFFFLERNDWPVDFAKVRLLINNLTVHHGASVSFQTCDDVQVTGSPSIDWQLEEHTRDKIELQVEWTLERANLPMSSKGMILGFVISCELCKPNYK